MNNRDQLDAFWPDTFKAEDNANRPAEPLYRAEQQDTNFGWPYCFFDYTQKKFLTNPEYGGDGKSDARCAMFTPPVAAFPAHWAPVDLMFYTGTQFPQKYRNGAFIAFHGSWNRAPEQAGYNVTFQPMANGKAAGNFEVFADGFTGKTTPLKAPGKRRRGPTASRRARTARSTSRKTSRARCGGCSIGRASKGLVGQVGRVAGVSVEAISAASGTALPSRNRGEPHFAQDPRAIGYTIPRGSLDKVPVPREQKCGKIQRQEHEYAPGLAFVLRREISLPAGKQRQIISLKDRLEDVHVALIALTLWLGATREPAPRVSSVRLSATTSAATPVVPE